jgi:hypothetical protein
MEKTRILVNRHLSPLRTEYSRPVCPYFNRNRHRFRLDRALSPPK